MSSGNIIEAIFGFCFIHDFAEISEVFEEKTMIFVNHICDIVHACVDKFNGYTNKNIGDCFLLAWKIKNSENKPPTKPISNKNIFKTNKTYANTLSLFDNNSSISYSFKFNTICNIIKKLKTK